ncbi:hypothetical protein [uncultured Helicobacter sp.]|uniref:hypothetical protein n=1 Tax=uncultured Helicobacter sp. TaxID=175537 RepID=UPI00375018EB
MRHLDERHSALSDKGNSSLTQSLSEHGGAACSFTSSKIPASPLVQHSNLTQDTRISGKPSAESQADLESNAGLESKFTQSHTDSEFAHKEAYKTPFPHLWQKINVQELENGAVFFDDFTCFANERAGSYLEGNDQTRMQQSSKSAKKTSQHKGYLQ